MNLLTVAKGKDGSPAYAGPERAPSVAWTAGIGGNWNLGDWSAWVIEILGSDFRPVLEYDEAQSNNRAPSQRLFTDPTPVWAFDSDHEYLYRHSRYFLTIYRSVLIILSYRGVWRAIGVAMIYHVMIIPSTSPTCGNLPYSQAKWSPPSKSPASCGVKDHFNWRDVQRK